MNLNIAIQMYTIREESQKDFFGSLRKVAELGYKGVEFAGYGNYSAGQIRLLLEELNLEAVSSHVPLAKLENQLDAVIEFEKAIGNKRIVCPFIAPERRGIENDYYWLSQSLNSIGEKCRAEGVEFYYHHHDFELTNFGQITGLEILLKETNPQWVKLELDVYWLQYAGENPVDWMKRYKERSSLIHLKDMTTDGKKDFAELGTGGIDLELILKEGLHDVSWWIVEQDQCRRSPFESIAISLDYLKNVEKIIL